MSAVMEIGAAEFEQKAMQAEGLVVVDFSAKWCGPCKRLYHELETAAQELGDKVTIVKVDIDESPEVANRFGVQGIPNLTFLKNGTVVDVSVGLIPRTTIVSRIKQNL